MIWLAPGVVLLVLALPVLLAARRCAAEAKALAGSMRQLGDLAPAVRELQDDVVALRHGVPAVRGRTRPARPPGS